ncbi:hypothetical protein D9M70_255030 [compost metagenome]
MQDEVLIVDVRVLVDMVNTLGIEGGGAALDAVDFVALFQQKFCEVGAVLACDAGDKGFFHCIFPLLPVLSARREELSGNPRLYGFGRISDINIIFS